MMIRRFTPALLALLLLATGADAGKGKIAMLDRFGMSLGSAVVKLAKGSAKANVALAPLPAAIDTGAEQFEATIYKAYLVNSLDPTVEIPLGDLYPNTKGKAKVVSALKGDVSGLGLDRLVVVAFSKDGLHSFDVLTGAIETE